MSAIPGATGRGTDVHLHPKVPLPVLLGLLHLGVATVALVLGRTGRADDGGVHDGPRLQQQLLLLQQLTHLGKDLLGQLVLLEQVAKVQNRRLVGNRVFGQFDAGKAPHRLNVVERILGLRIGEVEPLLHAVDAQHPFQRHRRATAPALRVVRLDQRRQPCPRHHHVHLGQETLAAGRSALGVPRERGKRRLFHCQPSCDPLASP